MIFKYTKKHINIKYHKDHSLYLNFGQDYDVIQKHIHDAVTPGMDIIAMLVTGFQP